MRLLVVATEFPPGPGGIGRHAHELARSLAGDGWEVEAYVWQEYASAAEIAAFNAAQPFRVTSALAGSGARVTAVRVLSDLAARLASPGPDVVLASGRRAVWLTAPAARLRRVPWMAVGHGTEFRIGSRVSRAVSRRAYGAADVVVCVSDHTRGVMEAAGVTPRSTVVIPNGADPVRFRPLPEAEMAAARREWGLEGRRVVLTVGRVGRRKGQDVVIRALPDVVRAVPDAVYVMVGLPVRRSELAALARELGVEGHVRFLGRLDDEALVSVESLGDVFVMTSRTTAEGDFEGYGIAAVEAALCGVPAVVAGDSGLVEAIRDGETGYAVAPEDPAATARAILRLLEDEPLRRRMGARARERALAEQTWGHRAEAYARELVRIARPPA